MSWEFEHKTTDLQIKAIFHRVSWHIHIMRHRWLNNVEIVGLWFEVCIVPLSPNGNLMGLHSLYKSVFSFNWTQMLTFMRKHKRTKQNYQTSILNYSSMTYKFYKLYKMHGIKAYWTEPTKTWTPLSWKSLTVTSRKSWEAT